jgi:hypothetical protein
MIPSEDYYFLFGGKQIWVGRREEGEIFMGNCNVRGI